MLPVTSPPPIQTTDTDAILRELFAAHQADLHGRPPDAGKGEWATRDYMRVNNIGYRGARKRLRKLTAAGVVEVLRVYRSQKVYRFTDDAPK